MDGYIGYILYQRADVIHGVQIDDVWKEKSRERGPRPYLPHSSLYSLMLPQDGPVTVFIYKMDLEISP